jgi:hypothetical protein
MAVEDKRNCVGYKFWKIMLLFSSKPVTFPSLPKIMTKIYRRIILPDHFIASRDSSVGSVCIATRRLAGWPRSRGSIFLFCIISRPAVGPAQPPIQWVPPLRRAVYREVKRHGRKADHSGPSSAEVKNGVTIPPLPHTSSRCGA